MKQTRYKIPAGVSSVRNVVTGEVKEITPRNEQAESAGKEKLTKAMLGATYDGGVLSLAALEQNLKEIAEKSGGDCKLSINEFLELVGMFKDEYSKLCE